MKKSLEPTSAAEDDKTPAASLSAVDLQSQIDSALAEQSTKQAALHRAELKEATGYETVAELREAQQIEQGNAKEALAEKSNLLAASEKRFQTAQINNALLSASSESNDPEIISALLAGNALCDENGTVTIDGKPVADAVAALLKSKPFLAKAQGDTGSGAPVFTQTKNSKTRAEFDLLDQPAKAEFFAAGGTVI